MPSVTLLCCFTVPSTLDSKLFVGK